jgi:simple sugar transport system ATP-binding protein
VTRIPILEAIDVMHRYGRVTALADVSLTIRAGAVTCLMGDNGAGKSTLVKILTGVERPTQGTLRIDGAPIQFLSPADARACGIAAVYQDLALIPLLSVWRNFVLGAEPVTGHWPLRRLAVATAERRTREALDALSIALGDIHRAAGTLSGGERQAVAIARALHFGARVLILDEPTAALGVRQAAIVLDQIGRARERGVAVILVTHNPQHAAPIGDRFVVLRRGRVVGDYARGQIDSSALAAVMAGEGQEAADPLS